MTSIRVSLQTALRSAQIGHSKGARLVLAALLASGSEPVRGLLRGLGEAVFSWFVAGVGLVGHDLSDALSPAVQCYPAMKLLRRAAMHQQLFVPACADVQ